MRIITVARKPCSEPTVAANALKWGTGGLNIDGSRITTSARDATAMARCNSPGSGRLKENGGLLGTSTFARSNSSGSLDVHAGRWPANLILCHKGCQQVGERKVTSSNHSYREEGKGGTNHVYGGGRPARPTNREIGFASPDGTETIDAYECEPGCPVAALDAQSGVLTSGQVQPGYTKNSSIQRAQGGYEGGFGDIPLTGYGDTGGASRFFKQVGGQEED